MQENGTLGLELAQFQAHPPLQKWGAWGKKLRVHAAPDPQPLRKHVRLNACEALAAFWTRSCSIAVGLSGSCKKRRGWWGGVCRPGDG